MKFSVTIPTYKSKFLHEAIQSVLSQTYSNFELIIVDDCSPEDIYSIVKQFNDPRIRYYRNNTNCGAIDVVDNWNICLSYCTGDYVICMGDDDRLLPICLEEYKELIHKFPNLEVYHAQTEIIDEDGNVILQLEQRKAYETGIEMIEKRFEGRLQYIGDFCYDVSALRRHGGFYKLPLAWCSDDITAFRAASSNGIANTGSICFQYRENSYSISNGHMANGKLCALMTADKWYIDFFKTHTDCFSSDYKNLMRLKRECFVKMFCKQLYEIFVNDKRKILFYFLFLRRFHIPFVLYMKLSLKSFRKQEK